MISITYDFVPNKFQSKLINIIRHKIFRDYYEHYSFYYHTQKYTCTTILTKIFYVLYVGKNWRSLGDGWNNVYKHFIKLNELHIFTQTYSQLLQKYLTRHKRALRTISIDTTFIYNKYGTDNISRNSYAKNKNCNKLLTVIDSNGKSIYFAIEKGMINDSKFLIQHVHNFSDILDGNCKYVLADSGFDSKKIKNEFATKNIKVIIPTNIRNTKKDFKMKDLRWDEKMKIYFSNFTEEDKKMYSKRIKVENLYARTKQINRFNVRYDKKVTQLIGFLNIFYACSLINA